MLVRASLKIACAARPDFINQQRTGLLARPKSAAIFQRDEGAAAKNVTTALRNSSGFWMCGMWPQSGTSTKVEPLMAACVLRPSSGYCPATDCKPGGKRFLPTTVRSACPMISSVGRLISPTS